MGEGPYVHWSSGRAARSSVAKATLSRHDDVTR